MTEFEIIQSYRQAKNKTAQIGILSDLTGKHKDEINEILRNGGL